MKRKLCLIGLAATLALTLVPAVHAELDVFHLRGKMAEASFQVPEPEGCISTEAEIYLVEDHFQGSPESQEQGESRPRPLVHFSFIRYDGCQQVFEDLVYGSAPLSADAFSFSGLNSARVRASFEAEDVFSGAMIPVTVDLTWEGIGETFQSMSRERYNYPNYRFTSHTNGASRDAVAVGTLLMGTVNLAPGPSVYAGMRSGQYGSVTIYH